MKVQFAEFEKNGISSFLENSFSAVLSYFSISFNWAWCPLYREVKATVMESFRGKNQLGKERENGWMKSEFLVEILNLQDMLPLPIWFQIRVQPVNGGFHMFILIILCILVQNIQFPNLAKFVFLWNSQNHNSMTLY